MSDTDKAIIRAWSAIVASSRPATAEAIAERSGVALFLVRVRLPELFALRCIPLAVAS